MKMSLSQMIAIVCILAVGFVSIVPFFSQDAYGVFGSIIESLIKCTLLQQVSFFAMMTNMKKWYMTLTIPTTITLVMLQQHGSTIRLIRRGMAITSFVKFSVKNGNRVDLPLKPIRNVTEVWRF